MSSREEALRRVIESTLDWRVSTDDPYLKAGDIRVSCISTTIGLRARTDVIIGGFILKMSKAPCSYLTHYLLSAQEAVVKRQVENAIHMFDPQAA